MDMLSNHSEITDEGIQRILAACPKLHTLTLTFLGGAKAYGCRVSGNSLKAIKDQLNDLKSLAVSVDITSLPILSQMTSLESLRIRFCEPVPPPPPTTLPIPTTTTTTTGSGMKIKNEEAIPPIDIDLATKNLTELSHSHSENLKSLVLERLVFGWETFFRALQKDSFNALEQLSLSYNYHPSLAQHQTNSVSKPGVWTGSSLRSLCLFSTANLTLQPFMDFSLSHLELSCGSDGMLSIDLSTCVSYF